LNLNYNLFNVDLGIFITFLYNLLNGNLYHCYLIPIIDGYTLMDVPRAYDHIFLASLPERLVGYIDGTSSPPLPTGAESQISPISPILGQLPRPLSPRSSQ
jgi:hypothetical protein